jgi:ribA/ribD-fused uncharacterized protein
MDTNPGAQPMDIARGRFTFFWRSESPFSQWHASEFVVGGERFTCAEQYMMYGKAVLFGDGETSTRILAARTPKEHKALGREVRGFEGAVWERERERCWARSSHACARTCSPRPDGSLGPDVSHLP